MRGNRFKKQPRIGLGSWDWGRWDWGRWGLARSILTSGVILGGVSLAAAAHADEGSACQDLARLSLPRDTITLAVPVTSGTFTDDTRFDHQTKIYKDLPAFCRVRGVSRPTPDSEIGFEVWLPLAGWDRRLHMVGNGAYSSNIYYAQMSERLRAGDLAVATDTGHRGADLAFGDGHPEKIRDFAGRSVHESAVAAKAIAKQFYGVAPSFSYFSGCSTGGYQGLMAAQAYPDDFDGIIAGAPGNNRSTLNMAFLWNYLANHRAGDDKAQILQPSDLLLINAAAVKACDGLDGVEDGVISDPRQCHFDLESLKCQPAQTGQCLSDEQIAAAERIYAGPRNARTGQQIYPGYPFGSEGVRSSATDAHPGWSDYWADDDNPDRPDRADFFASWVFNDPNWNWWTFNWSSDVDTVHRRISGLFDANSPDLSSFSARKGKLIMFMGWADPVGAPGEAINYYDSVKARMKKTDASVQAFLRLYMIPGMDHCANGPGATYVSSATRDSLPPVSDARHDMLIALEDWVEHDRAPEALVATHYSDVPSKTVAFQRPICVYPKVVKYRGGPTDKADSFGCVAEAGNGEALNR